MRTNRQVLKSQFSIITLIKGTFLLQTIIWIAVGSLELIGLMPVQRILLQWLYVCYTPTFRIYGLFIPNNLQVRGNILFGFLAIGFGICLYAITIGLIAGSLPHMIKVITGKRIS